MAREYSATLSIDKTGSQTNEYQYLISALIQSGWILVETSLLRRRTADINDIWQGLKLVMKQAPHMDPISHFSLDVVSSADLDGGIKYPYSDKHPRALEKVDAKPLP
jgi:hypothetical protein